LSPPSTTRRKGTSKSLGLPITTIGCAFRRQLQAQQKLFVGMLRREWNRCHSQGFGRRRSPKSVCRHIAAHHGTSPDHRPFADSHVGQDDTMRPDEDVLFNDHFSVAGWSSGSRVKVGDDRRSEADGAVVSDGYVRGMDFINVHKLANPDVASDRNSAQPLQPRSQTESPRSHKSYLSRKPTEQKWQRQRFRPLISRSAGLEIGPGSYGFGHRVTTGASHSPG